MSGYGTGIQRGRMAGDNFTQIANALFRDTRMGFKAKGIFGLISTHTDGWRVTVADLVRAGTDGKSAVTSGLKELEKFGYLTRDRERNTDGTLGGRVLDHGHARAPLRAVRRGRPGTAQEAEDSQVRT